MLLPLILLSCEPKATAIRPDTATDGGTDGGSDGGKDGGTDAGTEPPAVPVVLAVSPWVADTAGGGGPITVTLDSTDGLLSLSLGDSPLTDLVVLDGTRVSGRPGPHPAGRVDVRASNAAGSSSTEEDLFEYWTPAQIEGIDLYLDADKGHTAGRWLDQGPHARELLQPDPALQPVWTKAAFGSMPGLRFTPQQYLRLAAPVDLVDGSSIFAVASWTATADLVPPPGNSGNVPLTIVGDGVSAYGAFGAQGDQVQSNHYVGGPVLVNGGAGLNDGIARLIGASYDSGVGTIGTSTRIFVGSEQQGVDDISAPLIGRNSYDTIGAGYPGVDGWDGLLGAVIISSGVIGRQDLERLDQWSQQRWGTPPSPPLDPWTRQALAELPLTPDEWLPRDGAQMVQLSSGRILMIGGWSPYDPWGGDRTTNEVWASDDRGESWELLLPHDPDPPQEGPGSRFPPGHTVGVSTLEGHAVVIGSDCLNPPLLGEVWVESDEGSTWTLVSTEAPSAGRCLHMVATLGTDLYLMGGQSNLYDESSAIADVWRSSDGGRT